jgi:hypothetical protein
MLLHPKANRNERFGKPNKARIGIMIPHIM